MTPNELLEELTVEINKIMQQQEYEQYEHPTVILRIDGDKKPYIAITHNYKTSRNYNVDIFIREGYLIVAIYKRSIAHDTKYLLANPSTNFTQIISKLIYDMQYRNDKYRNLP